MQLKVSRIPTGEPEVLEIRCHRISDNVQEIISFVKSIALIFCNLDKIYISFRASSNVGILSLYDSNILL